MSNIKNEEKCYLVNDVCTVECISLKNPYYICKKLIYEI